MQHYHDSVPETPENAARYEESAKKQDEAVLTIFQDNPDRGYTPSEICERLGDRWPITSIRRAITNLTDAQELRKTGIKQQGRYGRSENVWIYRVREPQQGRLI